MVLRRVHAAVAIVFVVAIIVQVFLAGAAIANLGGSGNFETHIEFGYTWIGLAALALLVTALAARRPRREVGIALALLLLYIVQTILPGFRASASWVAALHPVNALLLFALASWYARRAWQAGMS
jgi:mercuric ion transport protein